MTKIKTACNVLDFQYMDEVDDFNDFARESQIRIIKEHITNRMINVVHTLSEHRHNAETVNDCVNLADVLTQVWKTFQVTDTQEAFMDAYHPLSILHVDSSHVSRDPAMVTKMIKDAIMVNGGRDHVVAALKVNREFKLIPEAEIEEILQNTWNWDWVVNSTEERWETFCRSWGNTANSGPTIDEWAPSQLPNDVSFSTFDGYITIPLETWHDEPLSTWAFKLLHWVQKLDNDIDDWCSKQPDIIDFEPACVWGDILLSSSYTDEKGIDLTEIQVTVSVAPKISLIELVLHE